MKAFWFVVFFAFPGKLHSYSNSFHLDHQQQSLSSIYRFSSRHREKLPANKAANACIHPGKSKLAPPTPPAGGIPPPRANKEKTELSTTRARARAQKIAKSNEHARARKTQRGNAPGCTAAACDGYMQRAHVCICTRDDAEKSLRARAPVYTHIMRAARARGERKIACVCTCSTRTRTHTHTRAHP